MVKLEIRKKEKFIKKRILYKIEKSDKMDTQKIVVVLLIIAILFSIATIWKAGSADTDDLIPAGTNTITTIESDSGTVGIEELPPPTEGEETG